jgi:hypothetical protein
MLRHLKNATELTLYAGLSCAAAFLVRLNPALFYPVLLLRLSILGYCWYVIARAEGSLEVATVLIAAVFVGWVGGYWDWIETQLTYNLESIVFSLCLMFTIPIVAFAIYLHLNYGQDKENRQE